MENGSSVVLGVIHFGLRLIFPTYEKSTNANFYAKETSSLRIGKPNILLKLGGRNMAIIQLPLPASCSSHNVLLRIHHMMSLNS